MRATDLSVGDIGKNFRSALYRDNNKTSLPIGQHRLRGRRSGPILGEPQIRTWTLTTLYAHKNGNIMINDSYHLRPDTELVELDEV